MLAIRCCDRFGASGTWPHCTESFPTKAELDVHWNHEHQHLIDQANSTVEVIQRAAPLRITPDPTSSDNYYRHSRRGVVRPRSPSPAPVEPPIRIQPSSHSSSRRSTPVYDDRQRPAGHVRHDLVSSPSWQQFYDTEQGKPYYHNSETGDTRWTPPPGFVKERRHSQSADVARREFSPHHGRDGRGGLDEHTWRGDSDWAHDHEQHQTSRHSPRGSWREAVPRRSSERGDRRGSVGSRDQGRRDAQGVGSGDGDRGTHSRHEADRSSRRDVETRDRNSGKRRRLRSPGARTSADVEPRATAAPVKWLPPTDAPLVSPSTGIFNPTSAEVARVPRKFEITAGRIETRRRTQAVKTFPAKHSETTPAASIQGRPEGSMLALLKSKGVQVPVREDNAALAGWYGNFDIVFALFSRVSQLYPPLPHVRCDTQYELLYCTIPSGG